MKYISTISYLSYFFIYFSKTMIPSRLILLCLTTLWSFTSDCTYDTNRMSPFKKSNCKIFIMYK